MKSTTIALAVIAAASGACVAQVGPTGDTDRDRDTGDCSTEPYTLTITTEADLRDIPRGCFSLEGDLVIERSALTDLSALSELRDVRGSLRIEDNSALTTLSGLVDVRVSGDLVIDGNARLADLAGLDGTDELTALTLRANDALRDLSGLRSLREITGDALVSDNRALGSLAGLDRVDTIGGDLILEQNDQLTSLTGLSRLSSVSTIALDRNAKLGSVGGLSALTTVDRLRITGNTALSSLTGLGVTRVAGDLDVENNGLTTLGSLANLQQVDGNLIIASNPSLTGIDGLSTSLRVNGSLRVTSNPRLTSIFGLYLGASASNLVITGNSSLSRPRADHMLSAQAHQLSFPIRSVTGNGSGSDPVENH